MDELAKEYIISLFNKRLMMHGDRAEAVGWSSSGQLRGFESMLGIGDIRGSRILDFGCGKGDYYGFLQEKGIDVSYSGFDINEQLIDLARKKYPGIDFRVFHLDRDILDEDFDYIFLCGVFNVKVDGIESEIRKSLSTLWGHCRKALAFNALSSDEPRKDFALHYTSPVALREFAEKKLSSAVSVKVDDRAHDFTMFVFRQ
jgi:SAM-dependent methyltransferase